MSYSGSSSQAQPSLPAVPQFRCELRSNGRAATWISLSGELDLAAAAQFEQALQRAFSDAALVVVDLRGLTFIDSTGLHMIIDTDADARRNSRRLVIIRGRGQIDRLFTLLGLSDQLQLIDLKPVLVADPPPTTPAPSRVRPGSA